MLTVVEEETDAVLGVVRYTPCCDVYQMRPRESVAIWKKLP